MSETRREVLFLIPTLRGGGAERVIATLLRHLDRSKFKLALAVVDTREAVYLHDVPQDVEMIDLQCSRVRHALPKIVRLIWRRRPDVVFSTLGHLNLALAIIRPLLPDGMRYVARETSIVSETLCGYPLPRWWRWAYRRFYRRFDSVVCQSRYMRDDLLENFRMPPHKMVVINNPVDVERVRGLGAAPLVTGFEQKIYNDAGAPIHLIAAGRLVREKGFDLLIEAVAICGHPRLRLTILGDGPLRGELERLAQDKGVARQVRFAGFQNNPYPFFARADAFVLSSRHEGFPNVVVEALACGTPVIATPAPGGMREISESTGGVFLASSISAEGIAASLRQFIGQEIRRDLISAGPFALNRIMESYEKLLLNTGMNRHLCFEDGQ